MEVEILFNSKSTSDDFSIGWGLSFLIDKRILFDTGEKGVFLLNNINKLNIDISLIESVVISHEHWDHTGGLWEVLKLGTNLNIYLCPSFSDEFKKKVKFNNGIIVETDGFVEVAKDVYITKEIVGKYKGIDIAEQAVVLDTDKGLSIITGCAHPGIIDILKLVRKEFSNYEFYAVFGGFHLMNEHHSKVESIVSIFKEMGIKKVGPTHCSGTETESIFKEKYGDDFIEMKVGQVITV